MRQLENAQIEPVAAVTGATRRVICGRAVELKGEIQVHGGPKSSGRTDGSSSRRVARVESDSA